MKKLVIVDGSGFLFRAWFAFPPMINAQGNNQNVLYGFTRMILKLIDETSADYFIIARDSPVKTKRHELYSDYKGTRPKIDDDFKQQIPQVHKLIEELGIATYQAPGYEADDIIFSFVREYQKKSDLTLEIVSSDKDLKQLLQANVVITDAAKNQTTTLLTFQQEWGFSPEYIVDYLALIGDSADNIKGVAGIWPKGAMTLVQTYGSIENIYDHLWDLSPKLAETLSVGKDDAFFSKKLIELMQVPQIQGIDLETWQSSKNIEQWEQILLNQYGFSSLQKLLESLKKKYAMPQQLGLF